MILKIIAILITTSFLIAGCDKAQGMDNQTYADKELMMERTVEDSYVKNLLEDIRIQEDDEDELELYHQLWEYSVVQMNYDPNIVFERRIQRYLALLYQHDEKRWFDVIRTILDEEPFNMEHVFYINATLEMNVIQNNDIQRAEELVVLLEDCYLRNAKYKDITIYSASITKLLKELYGLMEEDDKYDYYSVVNDELVSQLFNIKN